MNPALKIAGAAIAGAAVTAAGFGIAMSQSPNPAAAPVTPSAHIAAFTGNITQAAAQNQDFRRVVFTGTKSQLVVMSIPPGGEVGQETHMNVEQTLFFQSGTGEASLDGKKSPIGPGDVVVVTPGTQHNFRNTGAVPVKIFTIYAPPTHIDGRIHKTIQDASADAEDEAFSPG
jgi:mannose-6-phosphate isomerase-like protein (cupin superfamily)